jgi:hypothetical protein
MAALVEAAVARMDTPADGQNVSLFGIGLEGGEPLRSPGPIIPSRRRFHNCILIAERDHDSGGSFQICYLAGIGYSILGMELGLRQLPHSGSQSHGFACGSMVLRHPFVCGFSTLCAEKPHTMKRESTALPKAQYSN